MAELIKLFGTKQAEAQIHALAMDSSKVIITFHAAQRMEERGFTTADLVRVLTTGIIMEAPRQTGEDDWTCKIIRRLQGSRDAGVITIIVKRQKLIIKTMEWEDIR